jgi:hypothetical protein
MEQTTARLRKTFQYPTDNDSEDSLPEALDEQGKITSLLQQSSAVLIPHSTQNRNP